MKRASHFFLSTPLLIGCVCILVTIGFIPYFLSIAYTHKMLDRGIFVGSIDAKGMNEETLRNTLEQFQQTILDHGIPSVLNGHAAILNGNIQLNSDIPDRQQNSLATIDDDATVQNAFSYGYSLSFFDNALTRAALLFSNHRLPLSVSVNRDILEQSLRTAFPDVRRDAQQADIAYNKKTHVFEVVPERSGTLFDTDSLAHELEQSLKQGIIPTLAITTKNVAPDIASTDVQKTVQSAYVFVRPISIRTDAEHVWDIDASLVAQWITVKKSSDETIMLAVRSDAVASYLEKIAAPDVFIERKDPRFEMKNGKIIITTRPQNGRRLNIQKSTKRIAETLFDSSTTSLDLEVEEYASAMLTIPSQDSIKEIVAQAQTDFKGSPKNRRLNIANGVSHINGILIQPDEEFSLLRQLKPIDDTNGFLPELVIKGNATKPEFGGGLCQVSTTLFRAVAFAGLPVTMRRNHSYRVSYYEPPVGFDATIYSPSPDFRFKNDMATPILLHAEVRGTKLIVTFWGTKDGRVSEVDKPTVYNIKKPSETKIIETTELKPGEKKCTEKAHSGADAYFERRVTYPSGEVKKDIFKSHYIVWPAVCYVGIAPNEMAPEHIEPASPAATPEN